LGHTAKLDISFKIVAVAAKPQYAKKE